MAPDAAQLAVILQRVSEGDTRAFEHLYDASSAKLFGIVTRITRDKVSAEDALQEVYLKIWRQAGIFDTRRASPITWMATIARNTAIDAVRRRSREVQPVDEDPALIADEAETPGALVEADEASARLHDCLQGLEQPHRDVVKLAYLNGYSRQELSERFKTPIGTIKTWLRRSLNRLKDCLAR